MDPLRIAPWLVLVVVAVVTAFLVVRARRARARRAAALRAAADAPDHDAAFLDSSHISGPIGGLSEHGGDAAAQASAALRKGETGRR
jgi:hypothetical protein